MERFFAIVLGAATLVMAVATAMLGFTLPSIWTLQSDVGGAKATLASIDKRLDGLDKKLDGLDEKLAQAAKRIDVIDLRLSARDTDPATILAALGLRPVTQFVGVRVEDRIFALPRTDEAAATLKKAVGAQEALAPSIFGFELGRIDDTGRFVPASTGGTLGPVRPKNRGGMVPWKE